jgi:FkbM family methyltransferase
LAASEPTPFRNTPAILRKRERGPRGSSRGPRYAVLPHRRHPLFISYAQNLEDVVLHRALRDVDAGTYVDVGAYDPVVDSVTWAFHTRGWRGVNVEPVPWRAEAIRRKRPTDTTFAVAAGAVRRSAQLFASPAAGTSTLDAVVATDAGPVERVEVPVVPLDELLVEAGFEGRTIHFCTIDVEGAEADVLEGFDVERWQPWILVVEATEPNSTQPSHELWEPLLLETGYRFCLFDGLNRFYVARGQAARLGAILSYPACVFDRPFERAEDAARRAESSRAIDLRRLRSENERLRGELAAIRRSVSWRATRPLRALRRAQNAGGGRPEAGARDRLAPQTAFARRLAAVSGVLQAGEDLPAAGVDEAIAGFVRAVEVAAASDSAKAWLALLAADGAYPSETDVARFARRLRMDGSGRLGEELRRRFLIALERRRASDATLRVVGLTTVVDVTQTLSTPLDRARGRVARELVGRWLREGREIALAAFDDARGALRAVTDAEVDGLREKRPVTGSEPSDGTGSTELILPWGCTLVLTGAISEPRRCNAYRSLATADVLSAFSVVGYDLAPITASDTVADGTAANVADYLSVVKHADRIAAVSKACAADFGSFMATVSSPGRAAPAVRPLPPAAEAPRGSSNGDGGPSRALQRPLVLAVNDAGVLEAAEQLWREGLAFELRVIGDAGAKSDAFDDLFSELVGHGRPVTLERDWSEDDLWAAYAAARFTVFPALEGFALAVAESLASGTPVVTSRHGSLAETAEGGGCLTVDPNDVDAIGGAMRQLLRDDELLERLRREAADRRLPTWDEYADDVWAFLVEGRTS